MSAYITVMTPMMDRECLLHALADVGFGPGRVEVSETPIPLLGYAGRQQGQSAELVIRREQAGTAIADIGFRWTSTGFQAVLDQDDRGRYGPAWLQGLHTRYREHAQRKQERLAEAERQRLEEQRRQLVEAQRQVIHEKARKMGYRVQETRDGDRLRLVLVKRVY